MTLDAIRALIRQIHYKPGWRIHAEANREWKDVVITIDARVRDSRRKGWVILRATQWATLRDSRRTVLARVEKAIRDLEKHEFGEWYRVGKERPYDPH